MKHFTSRPANGLHHTRLIHPPICKPNQSKGTWLSQTFYRSCINQLHFHNTCPFAVTFIYPSLCPIDATYLTPQWLDKYCEPPISIILPLTLALIPGWHPHSQINCVYLFPTTGNHQGIALSAKNLPLSNAPYSQLNTHPVTFTTSRQRRSIEYTVVKFAVVFGRSTLYWMFYRFVRGETCIQKTLTCRYAVIRGEHMIARTHTQWWLPTCIYVHMYAYLGWHDVICHPR